MHLQRTRESEREKETDGERETERRFRVCKEAPGVGLRG